MRGRNVDMDDSSIHGLQFRRFLKVMLFLHSLGKRASLKGSFVRGHFPAISMR
jgi:hypothetical protein